MPADAPQSLMVVTPCSATKKRAVVDPPTYEQLADPVTRAATFARLANALLPAADLYGGAHHLAVMAAVKRLRQWLPQTRIGVAIVSAGYGVVGEHDLIVPYEATFAGLSRSEIARRSAQLGVRAALARRLEGCELAVFLLSEDYLAAVDAPITAATSEVYLTSAASRLDAQGVIHVPAGRNESRLLRVGPRMVKAVIFSRFVDAVAALGWAEAIRRLTAGDLVQGEPVRTAAGTVAPRAGVAPK